MDNKDNKERAPIWRFLWFCFETVYAWFMRSNLKTKAIVLLIIFLLVLTFTYLNLNRLLSTFVLEGGNVKDHYLFMNWDSRETVFVIFVSWVPIAFVMMLFGQLSKNPKSISRSFWSLCIYPWLWDWSVGFGPSIFLVIATYALLVCCYFRKRYLWICTILLVFVCLSLYLLGVTVCCLDLEHTKSVIRYLFNW